MIGLLRKVAATESLQPSPMPPDCRPPRQPVEPPLTRRLDRPWVFSCQTTVGSKSPSSVGPPLDVKMNICMRGREPSGGVEKFALFVPPPSCASTLTGSFCAPPLPKLVVWKLPEASVKPSL